MFTHLRNALAAKHPTVTVPWSKINMKILALLINQGYLIEAIPQANYKILVTLKYYHNHPVIDKIERVSKGSCRVYSGYHEMPKSLGGLGIMIISTTQGIMSDYQARELKIGGEIIGKVS